MAIILSYGVVATQRRVGTARGRAGAAALRRFALRPRGRPLKILKIMRLGTGSGGDSAAVRSQGPFSDSCLKAGVCSSGKGTARASLAHSAWRLLSDPALLPPAGGHTRWPRPTYSALLAAFGSTHSHLHTPLTNIMQCQLCTCRSLWGTGGGAAAAGMGVGGGSGGEGAEIKPEGRGPRWYGTHTAIHARECQGGHPSTQEGDSTHGTLVQHLHGWQRPQHGSSA